MRKTLAIDLYDAYRELSAAMQHLVEVYTTQFIANGRKFTIGEAMVVEALTTQIEFSVFFQDGSGKYYCACPFEYLWDDNWIETEKARREEVRLKLQQEKEEKEMQEAEDERMRRQRLYAQLREEFENED